jgi:UDP-N-acetylmuramate dehydrogenase
MEIKENYPLADKNWFKTGGCARFFAQPVDDHDFTRALLFARTQSKDIFFLGQGANILVSDSGFDGLIINPQNNIIKIDNTEVTAGAGVGIQALIDYCLDHGLVGLEELSGIPGSVGGSVYINIHYFEFLLSQFLVRARVISRDTGDIKTVDRDWFGFGYDHSRLFDKKEYLLDATFKLKPADELSCAYAKGRRDEIIRHRHNRYPRERTCGSFFRNFLPHEVPFEIKGKKILFIAYYLDKLGIKGELSVGGAIVSYQHANMIVTTPGATSADVIALAHAMQELVYKHYRIIPQPECQFVGFNENPLLSI